MSEVVIPGLFFGLMSNFHCLGMCGPFAMSLPIHSQSSSSKILSVSAYQLGRISTYTFLGALFGLFGKSISIAGLQQGISIGAGILIIVSVIIPKIGNSLLTIFPVNKLLNPLQKAISYFYKNQSVAGFLMIGLSNGLFPCGMVYLAIAAAFSMGSVAGSTLFMLGFGLGTLPAMVTVTILGQWMSLSMRKKFSKVTPYLFGLVGVLLIVRGLGFNIPYLSPSLEVPPIEARDVHCH